MTGHEHKWDAVIVNFNGSVFLDPCLRSLAAMTHAPARMIVVDNASTDDSLLELSGWPSAEVIESSSNRGYAGGANLGIHASSAPLAVVMNPDVELDRGFGEALVRVFLENPSLGAAGGKLRFPNQNAIQHAGGCVHWPALTTSHRGEREADDGQFDDPHDVDYVTGAALALRREAFDAVGGFDEAFHPAYWEDVDLCWRLKRSGWAIQYHPSLSGIHHEGAGIERGEDYFRYWTRNRLRFATKHLTHEQWWREFVPAEMARLRGEMSAAETRSWPVRSGAASIEVLARAGSHRNESIDSEISSDELLAVISAIRELPGLADPSPPPLTPKDGVMRRLKRFLGRFSGRIYAEELYWQQRQFNESLVRAFEAQDRLNREVVAQMLLSLLLISRREVAGDKEVRRHDGPTSENGHSE